MAPTMLKLTAPLSPVTAASGTIARRPKLLWAGKVIWVALDNLVSVLVLGANAEWATVAARIAGVGSVVPSGTPSGLM